MDCIKSRNIEFINNFSSTYTFLYDDYSERFGKLKIFQCKKGVSSYNLVALKEVEVQQVEDKLKSQQLQIPQKIEDFVDDFIMAVEKVNDNSMNNHPCILQMIAYQCHGQTQNSSIKFNKIAIYYEYFANNIMSEAKKKYCLNEQGIPENEIWQILYNVTSVMSYLEGQNRWIGDLISENIYYTNSNGSIKISPYKMSPMDDIKKQYLYVKHQNSQQWNSNENFSFQQNNLSSFNITKYFKSDTLSLGISIMRAMICNDIFSFEVFEEIKKGYIEQTTLKMLKKKCDEKYDGMLSKFICVMIEENEQNRPSGTDLYKFLLKYSDKINKGTFDGSQITELSFLQENGISYDFKKSPSLLASQKYSSIIRRNSSFTLDGKEKQEDENNKMQKILDSVKKIINKKVVTDNLSNSYKDEIKKQKKENENRDKIENDTYESLSEATAKESMQDLQQIYTENAIQSKRNSVVGNAPIFQKLNENQKQDKDLTSLSEITINFNDTNNQNKGKFLKNIINNGQKNLNSCSYSFHNQDINQNKNNTNQIYINNNPINLDDIKFKPNLGNKINQIQNTSMNHTIANNYYNQSNYSNKPEFNNQANIHNHLLQNEMNNTKNQNSQQQGDNITIHLNTVHAKQVETIQLAYKELEKIQNDIQELTVQRNNLLEQNKRLLLINNQLINSNKDQTMQSTLHTQKPLDTFPLSSERNRDKILSDRSVSQKSHKRTSQSQPPQHYIDISNSPLLNSISSTSNFRQVSKTPIQIIPIRELNLPQKHLSQPPSKIHSPGYYSTQKEQLKNILQNNQLNEQITKQDKKNITNTHHQLDFINFDERQTTNHYNKQSINPLSRYNNEQIGKSGMNMNKGIEQPTIRKNNFMEQIIDTSTNQQQKNYIILSPEVQKTQNNYTTQLQKLVQQHYVSTPKQEQDKQKQFLRSPLINQDQCSNNIQNGKCINIYQIQNPSGCVSRDLSPQYIKTPIQFTPIKQQSKVTIEKEGNYFLNHQRKKSYEPNSNQVFVSKTDESLNRQIRHISSHQPTNTCPSENKQDDSQLIRVKSSSTQLYYPLHLQRQSQVNNILNNNKIIDQVSINNTNSISNIPNQSQLSQLIKQNTQCENIKIPSQQQQNQTKVEDKNEQKKSSSLPRPLPSQYNSTLKENRNRKISTIIYSEDLQKITTNLMNNQMEPKKELNPNNNNQILSIPTSNQSTNQYSMIYRKQSSLVESAKFGQATFNQTKNENKQNQNQNQQIQLKTLQPNNLNNLSQSNDILKGYAQIYNSQTPTHQQQSTKNLNQFNQQISSQRVMPNNYPPPTIQNVSKVLTQIGQNQTKKQEICDKQSLINDGKFTNTKTSKNLIPPTAQLGVGLLKKSSTSNDFSLKLSQNINKNQFVK